MENVLCKFWSQHSLFSNGHFLFHIVHEEIYSQLNKKKQHLEAGTGNLRSALGHLPMKHDILTKFVILCLIFLYYILKAKRLRERHYIIVITNAEAFAQVAIFSFDRHSTITALVKSVVSYTS